MKQGSGRDIWVKARIIRTIDKYGRVCDGVVFYDQDGDKYAGSLYCPNPDTLTWKPIDPQNPEGEG